MKKDHLFTLARQCGVEQLARKQAARIRDGLEIKTPDEWKARSYALRDKYEGLVFDRSLRGTNAASRVLGVGHLLFDIALEESRNLPVSFSCVNGLASPLLIVTVEDEVTGTGALVHRLVLGVTEAEGKIVVLRDWELLRVLNTLGPQSPSKYAPAAIEIEEIVGRLKKALDGDLPTHAPTLRRPNSWPEMLFIPCLQMETKPT
jgi:hypothetical protein